MAVTVIGEASILRQLAGSIASWRDPLGVLSVTVGVEPGAGSGGTPPWAITVENDLASLRRDAAASVKRRFDQASELLEELLDPVAEMPGRALYIALGSGATQHLELPCALPTGARIGPAAHVLPLLQTLAVGEPGGLVMASKDQVVVLESELSHVREIDRIELEPWVGDWWPEMKGPSRANPLRGQHAVSQRDRYARRVAVAYRRTLREARDVLGTLANERQWTRAALAGDPRTVDTLDRALHESGVSSTVVMPVNLEGLRVDQALERLKEQLETLTFGSLLQHARVAREEGAAGDRGACGQAAVIRALNEARVAALVIDSKRRYPGHVEPDGTMCTSERAEETADLTDLIVVRALETGADVIPVLGEAAEELRDCSGIAARLRW